jgi:YcaO-like protein with predicted kinase domain
MGRVISVTAGKDRNHDKARAAAIAEAIEYFSFENPPSWFHADWEDYDGIPITTFFEKTNPIPVDYFTHLLTGKEKYFPAHILWLHDLYEPKVADSFFRSSNGNAVGIDFEDALLTGLYECIERDAIAIHISDGRLCRLFPCHEVEYEVSAIKESGLNCHLLWCTSDIPVPVVAAIITDQSTGQIPFAGWGTDLDLGCAQQKAVLEAIQSRAVYIAGARDDIQKSRFLARKEEGHKDLIAELNAAPYYTFERESYYCPNSVKIVQVLSKLGKWAEKVYYRKLDIGHGLTACKTWIRGFEQPPLTKHWTSTGRTKEVCEKRSSSSVLPCTE